jgi:hypothetical protein
MAATVIGVLGALEERGALRLDRNKLEEGK